MRCKHRLNEEYCADCLGIKVDPKLLDRILPRNSDLYLFDRSGRFAPSDAFNFTERNDEDVWA